MVQNMVLLWLLGYSNYGKNTVDVFAPGSQIYSTYPKNDYEFASGTSMAAPLVAGVAALIFSQYPNLSAAQVKQILDEHQELLLIKRCL